MPPFHCPLGAVGFEATGCISCGLCVAQTKEEAVAASKRLREYLKAHTSARQSKYLIQKMVVCGKGGVGKSTIATLMPQCLSTYGYKVLVIDTDESNPGLFRNFGFQSGPKPLMKLLSRFSLGEGKEDAEWLRQDRIAIRDIPKDFLLEQDSLRFMMVGKIEDPFQGCACSMADITRDLMIKVTLEDREVILIDQEAGVESFGRGVERGVDTVLIVVEPSFESLALAERISYMAEGIGIQRTRAILNKIPSEDVEAKVIEELLKKGIKYLGAVYSDSAVNEAGFLGRPLGNSIARGQVATIARLMLDEAEMKYSVVEGKGNDRRS